MHGAQLKCQIAAENRVNELINSIAPTIAESVKTLIGKPIFKADESLRADVIKVLNIPELDPPDQIFFHRSKYNLAFTFKTCRQSPHENERFSDHCAYASTTVYFGDVDNNVLTEVKSISPLRTDYTYEEVVSLREAAAKAKKVYEAAKSACYPFGED